VGQTDRPEYWEEIYRRGDVSWDLGRATPVFRRLLDEGRFPPGRSIVLGAGSGHDAREFARRGFSVVAVDFAAEAGRAMEALADPAAPVEIVQSDIFLLPHAFDASFDYVLEYVCFCAIDPQRRPAYADLVARLLKPGGVFIDLAFPLGTRPGGPPYAVASDGIVYMFQRRGFTLLSREIPADSVPARCGIEELLIFQKGR
jgi:SAM-dependent methyltransferase